MGQHDWFDWRGMTCCRKCGIVKRSRNPLTGARVYQRACKGEVRITLRQAATDLLTAIDKRHTDSPGHFKYVTPWDEARKLSLALDLEAEATSA